MCYYGVSRFRSKEVCNVVSREDAETLMTSSDVCKHFERSPQWIHWVSRAHQVGFILGNTRVYAKEDIELMTEVLERMRVSKAAT